MEKLLKSKDAAAVKLLILYMLHKINNAINSIELTNYIIEERLISFIEFQQRINELIASNHLAVFSDSGVKNYKITGDGIALLSEMNDLIPRTEKNRVDRTVYKLRRNLINSRSVSAEYIPENEHSGYVRLKLTEGELSMLEVNIAIASKKEARSICKNWKANTVKLYAGIVELLLESTEDEDGGRDNQDGEPQAPGDIAEERQNL